MSSAHRRLTSGAIAFLYGCALLQFIRFYVRNTTQYLNLPAYLAGHERLPFQERLLPAFMLRGLAHFPAAMALLNQRRNLVPASNGAFFLISLISFSAAAILTQRLYRSVSKTRMLDFLVFPVFLYVTLWTYVLHNEANFSYPYDLLSLAFFTGGLYCIFNGHFRTLLAIMFVGTLNRETTLFLIGIYAIDAIGRSTATFSLHPRYRERLLPALRSVPWMRVAALFLVWLAVRLPIAFMFRHNDPSENFVRFGYNMGLFTIRMIPALLNICGFLFPVALLLWRDIQPRRFGSYGWICLIWFPIMFCTGVLVETRIYGELCSWTAIAVVLLAERHLQRDPPVVHTTEASPVYATAQA